MSTGGTTAPPLRMHRAASRDENHEVLRQINIATVLSQGPAFLYDAKGPCEETYDLSEPLEVGGHYDDFVSHTWRTRPNMKWFALLFEYNGALAYKAAHVTGFLVFLLQLLARFGFGWSLPIYMQSFVPGTARWHPKGANAATSAFVGTGTPFQASTNICTFWSGLVGTVFLLFGTQIQHRLLGRRRPVFFDKCCIHPTDRAKIKAGIDGLGEAIEKSDRVLVLADEHYFTRLWCGAYTGFQPAPLTSHVPCVTCLASADR